jgi:hypothetical protein
MGATCFNKGGFLIILCDFISTILDKFPEALPRQGCHLNKDAYLEGYRAMDNSCSGFGVGDHAGMGPLQRKPEKGYAKTMFHRKCVEDTNYSNKFRCFKRHG